MEPIRYLQPATFPPPALQHNSQEVYRKRKCSDSNESLTSERSKHNATTTAQCIPKFSFPKRQKALMWSLIIGIFMSLIQTIHTTPVFVDNPSLAQFQSGRNIRHLPCVVRKSGLSGTCMFAIDCIKQNGTHLGTCIDRFYFGSCCQIKDENNLFAPEISDNSIDQNTISHFVHESTTLPTSALYKSTTESQQTTITRNNNTTSFITSTLLNANKTATTSHSTRHPSRPTNTIASSSSSSSHIQTKRPIQNSTQRPSQFVVRTTKKPIITTKKPTTRTTTTTTTTKKTSTTARTTTAQTTHKPSRRRPTTTTLAPILTTDAPSAPSSNIDDTFQTTITPPKFFTFQMVETTTPTMTEPTNFVDFTTMYPPTFHTKRPHRPSNHSKPSLENKTSTATTISTTTETLTTKVRPSPPVRSTTKPKPTPATTLPARKPSTTKKPSTKRPKPTTRPVHTTLHTTTTERLKPVVVISTTNPAPLADETPPTTITHKKPSITTPQQVHTTHAPSTKPRPTASITKVPKPIITTTTTHKKPTTISSTITPTSRPKPKPSTTLASTGTKVAEDIATTKSPSTTKAPTTISTSTTSTTTTSTTFKPGLITWTNEEAEPGTNATIIEKWKPPQHPSQWLPVSTIAPEIPTSNKNNTASPATTSTTGKPTESPAMNSTEKIIVSVATSVSEAQRNETINPPKLTTTTTTSTTTTTPKPSTSPKPTTSTKPNLSTTTTTPIDAESTTIDFEAAFETSTESNWVTAATGSSTTIDGVTEDYSSTTIPPTGTTLPPNALEGMDYRQICGRRMFPEPRIVGGSNAAFGRWPWQISLRQWRTSTYLHKCGAALLNENWAITAAHCVDNVPPSDLLLRLGEYDLAEEEEPYGYQERRVQIVASHPQFDPRTFEYDLALLRFYEPVIFQPNIIPVCVPNSDEDFIGQTAFVTGWGRLYEDGPLPSVLQEVAVPVINNSICETMYRSAGYIEHIPHIFICAGWKKGGYDSCEGDSGGPMVIQREDDKRFQLGGVISWGIGCAEANQPGVYTRISEFRDWINQILQF